MKYQFLKKLHKRFKNAFTLMIVPNSSNKRILSCRIPFVVVLVIVGIIVFNTYIFFGYSTQIWQICRLQKEIATDNKITTKLIAEKSQFKPILNRNYKFELELAAYRQDSRKMLDTWKRVRQKGNLRFSINSRGINSSNKIGSFVLTPIASKNSVTTSLEQLTHNLDQLETILKKEKQEQDELLQSLQAYERRLDHTPSIWPVYARIASSFGVRFHPIYQRKIMHDGLDLAAEYGTKVRAAADGVVSFSGWEDGYGYIVKIAHDYGLETYYGHNSRLLVRAGQTVKKGQIICISGNSGESTGPHLHYEVRMNGKPINPAPYLKN